MFTARSFQYLLLVLLFAAVSCRSSSPLQPPAYPPPGLTIERLKADLHIKNVNIVDVERGVVIKEQDVLIRDKKITYILPAGKIRGGDIKVVIDGSGKFLVPGFWDMHVHTVDSSYLKSFIINGVTGIRDMGGAAAGTNNGCESIKHETLMSWRKLIGSGLIIGPRMLISGPGCKQ